MLSKLMIRLHALVRRDRVESEFDEELRYHIDREVERNVERGMSRAAAERAVRKSFGDVVRVKEEARETWRWRWLDEFAQDVRYALRSLAAQRAFTFMTLLALTVGIGVNTSLFNAFNAMLFRPWDVRDPQTLVRVLSADPRGGYSGLPIAIVSYFEQHSRTIESAYAQRSLRVAMEGTAGGESVSALLVSGGFFEVLGPRFLAGRPFDRSEDNPGAPAGVVVLSRQFWQERYAGDATVIGRTIRLESTPFTIVGVADAPAGAEQPDLWTPMAAVTLLRPRDRNNLARLTDPEFCCYEVFARLARATSYEQANAELTTMYRQFSVGAKQDKIGIAVAGTALVDHPEERSRIARLVAIAMTAVGSILLLACANVSNLLLARGTTRQREIAVRLSLGAARSRVIRQLMTESLLLAAIGCGLSLLIAPVLPPLVMRLRNQSPPPPLGLIPDAPVLAFALTISVLAAIAFGIAPALRTTRIPIIETLKTYGSRASARFPLEGVLVAVQVCISVALLLGAGLLLRGVTQARALDPGFRTEGLSALSVQLPRSAYGTPQERAFFDQLHSSLEASGQPIAMTAVLPLGDTRNFTDFNVAGVPAEARSPVAVEDVTTGYFPLLEMPIVAGRGFRADDRARGAIVINESLARRYWPDGNAIGQTVTIGDRPREIIGIVRNAQMHDIGRNEPIYFAPFSANSQGVGAAPVILVPTTAVARVTSIVRGEEPNAIVDLVSLSEQAEQSLGDAKGSARMASLLAWLALLLATCGVYGIISYSVERRRKEIMIRIALGARPRAVIGLVLQRNARPLLIGALLGVVVSVGEAVVLRSQLYGLNPLDPVVLAGVSAVLVVAGIAAAALPTRRAIRTDPVVALHEH